MLLKYFFKKTMKRICFIFFSLLSFSALATRYRAGEIVYSNSGGYSYHLTVRLMSDSAITDSVTIYFGDGDSAVSALPPPSSFPVGMQQVSFTHAFPGPGQYYITCNAGSRIPGIVNIPNSNSTSLLLTSFLDIDPILGNGNNSVMSLHSLLDTAVLNSNFIYNTGTYDP